MTWEIAVFVRYRLLNVLHLYTIELISNQYGNETEVKMR